MTRRPGLTLTEVLVTLAILAFGILAIMTLFPLAASQMAVAVRDSRSAQAAQLADSFFRAYWRTEVVDKIREGKPVTEPFFFDLTDPGLGPTVTPPAQDLEPSYPVVIDPFGFASHTSFPDRFGDLGGTFIRRRSLRVVDNQPSHFPMKLCSLPDSHSFDEFGRPTADREYRYNWLWVVQRPVNQKKLTANLTVVVFDRRPFRYAPPGTEPVYLAPNVQPGQNTLFLNGITDIRPGNWIMDATIIPGPEPLRHAFCYQVVSVTEYGSQTLLELNAPLRRIDGQSSPYTGSFVYLRGACGVSVRPPLTSGS